MTPAEHRQEAERLLEKTEGPRRNGQPVSERAHNQLMSAGQLHVLLALAEDVAEIRYALDRSPES